MAVNCGVSFGLCAVRLTVVDSAGNVVAGSMSYVTDSPIEITLTPNIESGNTVSVRNGCGCSVARFKFPDTFNWFEFSFNKAALEPEMEAFLLGGETIDDSGDVVGLVFPSSLDCDDDLPSVAFEYWTKHVVGSGQDGAFPWIHWVFPSTSWSLADNTFGEDATQISLNGFSRTNSNWGDGPYGDGPPDGSDISDGAYWKTDVEPPTADCAAQSVTSTS